MRGSVRTRTAGNLGQLGLGRQPTLCRVMNDLEHRIPRDGGAQQVEWRSWVRGQFLVIETGTIAGPFMLHRRDDAAGIGVPVTQRQPWHTVCPDVWFPSFLPFLFLLNIKAAEEMSVRAVQALTVIVVAGLVAVAAGQQGSLPDTDRPNMLGPTGAMGVAPVRLPDEPVVFDTAEQQRIRVTDVAKGFLHPWSLAFLPDGAILVTERAGRLRIVRNGVLDPQPIQGVPDVFRKHAYWGLMDIALHPRFAENRLLYFTYLKPLDESRFTVALARGQFDGHSLADVRDIFVTTPP